MICKACKGEGKREYVKSVGVQEGFFSSSYSFEYNDYPNWEEGATIKDKYEVIVPSGRSINMQYYECNRCKGTGKE
jgi:hypothetical protein